MHWSALVAEGARAGVDRARLEDLTSRLAAAGVTPEEGRRILAPALAAAKDGLPSRPVLNKINEGVLKRVSVDALAQASEYRLDVLHRARDLVRGRLAAAPRKDLRAVLSSVALALESGVPEPTLVAVLDAGRRGPLPQVKSVVEAAEALHLAGFDAETVEGLTKDCLERNLKRGDVLRVVQFATEKQKSGMEGGTIRAALWGAKLNRPQPAPRAGGSSPVPSDPGSGPTVPGPR